MRVLCNVSTHMLTARDFFAHPRSLQSRLWMPQIRKIRITKLFKPNTTKSAMTSEVPGRLTLEAEDITVAQLLVNLHKAKKMLGMTNESKLREQIKKDVREGRAETWCAECFKIHSEIKGWGTCQLCPRTILAGDKLCDWCGYETQSCIQCAKKFEWATT